MAKKPATPKPQVDREALAPPRHNHKGALGATMHKAHKVKRMDSVRQFQKEI
jgi:hypothetical protein